MYALWKLALVFSLLAFALPVRAQDLPSPLDSAAVARVARQRRAEVLASRARAQAARQEPRVVSALPDPTLTLNANHIPFDLHGIDASIAWQQEFPLSGVLANRKRAAFAEADRFAADTQRVALDVALEAEQAFYTLAQRRETAPVLDDQLAITEQLLVIARAHYAAGQGAEVDVLRLENEAARFRSDRRALDSEVRAAEASLNAALARDVAATIPALAWNDELGDPAPTPELVARAISNRPELASVRAERRRALAEVDVMKSLYWPQAFVTLGPHHMLGEGFGVMTSFGISLPIWGNRPAGVSEARSLVTAATSEVSAMELAISGKVAAARETVVAERTRLVAIQKDILPRQKQIVTSAMGSFGSGLGQLLTVLDSSRDLRDLRMQELAARARLGMAWAELRRETGE